MSIPDPKIGLVINYSYLWEQEAAKGRTEGVKDRPCIIIGMKDTGGEKTVLVAPITHSPPSKEGNIEVPHAVKSRLGLDEQKSWVVTSETNRFTWSQSPDLRPVSRNEPDRFDFGLAPQNMTKDVQEQVRNHSLEKSLSVTGRDESILTSNNQYRSSSTEPKPAPTQSSNPYRRTAPEPERKPDQPANPYKRPGIEDDTGHSH